MGFHQNLAPILTTALATSISFNVLLITFLLGEYLTLDREGRPRSEKEPYYYTLILLFFVLWVSGIALLLTFISVVFTSQCLIYAASALFGIQTLALIIGLSWAGYKMLSQ